MPSEAPSRATAASWAAEPVWVAVDFDRACGVRRRGARRSVRFAGIDLRGALCLLAGLLAGHRLRPLDPHRPSRCLHHHKPGARSQASGDPEEAVDMDSNACRAREVERKVWRDNDSLLRSLLLKTPQLVIGPFRCVNPAKARGNGAVSLALEQLSSEVADDAPPIAYCRASLKARRLGVTADAWLFRQRIGRPGKSTA